jgi:hypothetical protein
MSLGGTPRAVVSFKNWMADKVGSRGGLSKPDKTFWVLHYSYRDAEKVGACLYGDARGPRLCRKASHFRSTREQ